MKRAGTPLVSTLALALLLLAPIARPAQAAEPLAVARLQAEGLLFQPRVAAAGYSLTVSTPEGAVLRWEFTADQTPALLLADLPGDPADGVYTYQLTATPSLSDEDLGRLRSLRQGTTRGEASRPLPTLPAQSGSFTVRGGALVLEGVEGQAAADTPTAGGLQALPAADQVILDDLIVTSNFCVGPSCVNGESFGSDSIRLKDVNNRIHFQDTSTGSFPTNDWRIVINSDVSGGASFFAIEDTDASRQVFTIEAGTRANALYMDDAGRLGMGTATPVEDLHIRTGDTPTLRLEQDSSGSFTPQTWDIGGNESNFFVRDVTAGASVYPFRIRPGAPTSSIDIRPGGEIGMGTASPSAALHLLRSDGSAQLRVEETSGTAATRTLLSLINNGGLRVNLNDNWTITAAGGNLSFDSPTGAGGGAGNEAQMQPDGDFAITGNFISGGTTLNVPDYVFDPDYPLMPMEDLRAFITRHGHLPNVPDARQTREEGLNLTTLQLRLLEKIEELTLYTLEQQSTIEQLQQRLVALEGAGEAAP